jgi:hypothetical protein
MLLSATWSCSAVHQHNTYLTLVQDSGCCSVQRVVLRASWVVVIAVAAVGIAGHSLLPSGQICYGYVAAALYSGYTDVVCA